jgi:hypothetical protein
MASSFDYSIKAIPTKYNGRQYRSRLEARWAAFFDLLGWRFEYEPCDLGTWSPDFALWGIHPQSPVLVEVKPIDHWHRETARKMADACRDLGQRLLLVGTQPFFDVDLDQLGWLGQVESYEATWDEALLSINAAGRHDFFPNSGAFSDESWIWKDATFPSGRTTHPLWKEAANLVQWHPK